MYSFPPTNATVPDIIHHVSQFPLLEPPALFGLHDNAALTCNRAQATAFFESMMLVRARQLPPLCFCNSLNRYNAATKPNLSIKHHAAQVQRSTVAVSTGSGAEAAGGGEDGVAAVARDILARLPPLFDVAAAQAKCVCPMHTSTRFDCEVSVSTGTLCAMRTA